MSWIDLLGYLASACVLVTFCMKRMVPLRLIAICSNVLFAIFGAVAHIYPVLILHTVLLPVNLARLIQILPPPKEAPCIRKFIFTLVRAMQLHGAPRDRGVGRREDRNLTNLSWSHQNDVGTSRCDTDQISRCLLADVMGQRPPGQI
jgi:hypothetical protein